VASLLSLRGLSLRSLDRGLLAFSEDEAQQLSQDPEVVVRNNTSSRHNRY